MSLFGSTESLHQLEGLLTRPTGEDGEPLVGMGEALDAQVRVTVTEGEVQQVELGPRAKRAPDERLAEAIKEATNAAIRDLLQKRGAVPGVPSFEGLLGALEQVSGQAEDSFRATSEGLDAAMREVQQQALSQAERRR